MKLEEVLEGWKKDAGFMENVTHWEVLPAREGIYAGFPWWLNPGIMKALMARGVERLYSHQAGALEAVNRGEHTVVVTPTASGKTLCYNLPVVNTIMSNPEARALYLFPTKALSQDQVAELLSLVGDLQIRLSTYTYDGDTAPEARRNIRQSGHVVVTNPDMLHTGILPHHTKWLRLFSNLKYVVIDEVHNYRGVFGSHFANVLRRLKRVCAFYGSSPTFILCSATIANPVELTESLIEEKVTEICCNGAPAAEKHFIFYNPPMVNRELGIRRSAMLETRKIGSDLVQKGIQTIIFTRSRLGVEVLLTYLKESLKTLPGKDAGIRGYRGGYLPRERRSIEEGLRRGEIKAVVSTNALELGIDIGQLEACIMNGYPGTIASTWQQAGRAGRRSGVSLAVMVTNSEPLNQYMAVNPGYLLDRSPEKALLNPDNLIILSNHVRCAAFELPFMEGELFGKADIGGILEFLEDEQVLYRSEGRYHWMEESFPAEQISLRSAARENVVIIDTTDARPQVIGEVDVFSASMLVHEEAIYLHGGVQYQVEKFDFEEKKAFVRRVNVNYYTDANLAVDLTVLEPFEEARKPEAALSWGDVRVNALVSMFKKIRFNTHENLGSGPVKLPETEMHTTAFWVAFPETSLKDRSPAALQAGLSGLSYAAAHVAPLFLMGDIRDLQAVCQIKAPFTGLPTMYLYDNYPGGVGYSQAIYQSYRDIFHVARKVIANCRCLDGCPSCIGPSETAGEDRKKFALELIEVLLK